eukprot:7305812-Pyramimonas_sp.AAC.1
MARIEAPGVSMYALVAHAPHSANTPATKAAFWAKMREVCETWTPSLCFVDGDCHLAGGPGTEEAGCKGTKGTCSAGSIKMLEWLGDFRLKAANTFLGDENDYTFLDNKTK